MCSTSVGVGDHFIALYTGSLVFAKLEPSISYWAELTLVGFSWQEFSRIIHIPEKTPALLTRH